MYIYIYIYIYLYTHIVCSVYSSSLCLNPENLACELHRGESHTLPEGLRLSHQSDGSRVILFSYIIFIFRAGAGEGRARLLLVRRRRLRGLLPHLALRRSLQHREAHSHLLW